MATASSSEAACLRLGFSRMAAQSSTALLEFVSDGVGGIERAPVQVVTRHMFPRAVVTFPFSQLSPHPDFVKDIKCALEESTPNARTHGLRDVLQRWGQVIASCVEIGCARVALNSFLRMPDVSSQLGISLIIIE
jgi:hypothetical protein